MLPLIVAVNQKLLHEITITDTYLRQYFYVTRKKHITGMSWRELGRAVDVVMAVIKRIYVLVIDK